MLSVNFINPIFRCRSIKTSACSRWGRAVSRERKLGASCCGKHRGWSYAWNTYTWEQVFLLSVPWQISIMRRSDSWKYYLVSSSLTHLPPRWKSASSLAFLRNFYTLHSKDVVNKCCQQSISSKPWGIFCTISTQNAQDLARTLECLQVICQIMQHFMSSVCNLKCLTFMSHQMNISSANNVDIFAFQWACCKNAHPLLEAIHLAHSIIYISWILSNASNCDIIQWKNWHQQLLEATTTLFRSVPCKGHMHKSVWDAYFKVHCRKRTISERNLKTLCTGSICEVFSIKKKRLWGNYPLRLTLLCGDPLAWKKKWRWAGGRFVAQGGEDVMLLPRWRRNRWGECWEREDE